MSLWIHNITPVNAIIEGYDVPFVGSKYWFILTDPIVYNASDTHYVKMSNWDTYYPLVRQGDGNLNLPGNALITIIYDGTSFQVEGTLPAELGDVTGTLGLDHGGTGSDLSGTGPGVVCQQTLGAVLTVINPTAPIELTGGALRLNASAADRYLYSTSADTFTEGTITTFGRSLLDDADAAAGRTTLGAAAAATTITAGTGLAGGGDLSASRTIDLDFTDLTAATTPASADLVAIYDDSAGAMRKMTYSNFTAGLGSGSGTSDDSLLWMQGVI